MNPLIGCFIALVFALFALLVFATAILILDRDDEKSQRKRHQAILRAVRGNKTDDPRPKP